MRWRQWLMGAVALGAGLGAAEARDPLEALKAADATVRRFTLDNGVVCLIRPDRSAPLVTIQFWVGVGSIHEEEYLGAGLSHYLEHMVFKGTPDRPPGRISAEIADAGGRLNAYTSFDRTVYFCDLPSEHWQMGLDVWADAVFHANFPEGEWQPEKEVVLREVAMGDDDPNRVMQKLLWGTAYREHPFRFPVIGHQELVKRIEREDLFTFHRRHYTTDNVMVVIVGDVDPDAVEARLREVVGAVPRRSRAPVNVPAEPRQGAPREARQEGDYTTTRMAMAWHTVGLQHPDAPALDVLAEVVGRGRSSRLVQSVQEDRGLVTSVSAWSYTPNHPGLFAVSAEMPPENEAEVREALAAKVAGWADAEFSDEEIERAKRRLLVSELRSLTTMAGQARAYGSSEFYTGNPGFGRAYLAAVQEVTADRLREVARTYLTDRNRTTVVLAPHAEVTVGTAEEVAAEVPPVRRIEVDGVPVIVRSDPRLPFVHLAAVFRGGLLAESEENNGITSLVADLLTRGTSARTARDIAETAEGLGATLSGFGGRNSFGLTGTALTSDADVLAGLFADCLADSQFPEAEFARQRAIQIQRARQLEERPMDVAQRVLRKALYPNHPYRFHPLGAEEALAQLDRDALRAYARRLMVRGNAALAVFGDVDEASAREIAGRIVAALPEGSAAAWEHPPAAPELPARVERREPRAQSILLMGFPGVAIGHPDSDVLELIQDSMSGLASNLGVEVRDRRGLVYFIGAFQMLGLEPGQVTLYAGTREDAVGEVEELMRAELARLKETGLTAEEIGRARARLLAQHARSLQDNLGLAQMSALYEIYGLGYDYAFRLPERLAAIDAEATREAARTYFDPACEAVTLVLPQPREP